ncbi:hypothetical protein BGZ94_008072, partial [Podila epigama]
MADPASQSLDIDLGARVEYNDNLGYVRYTGQTSFAPGKWVGIELDLPRGKNSGVVEGKRYFDCKASHGVFVRPNQVRLVLDGVAQAPVTTGRTSRPVSTHGTIGAASSRLSGTPSRPSSIRTTAASSLSSPAARSSRTPSRRPTSIIETPSTPESRRTRVAPQTSRDEDAHSDRPPSSISTSSATISAQHHRQEQHHHQQQQQQQQQQHQQQLKPQQQQLAEEERLKALAQEWLTQQKLEQEEVLAQQQQQQDQQGFAPLSASASLTGVAAQAGNALSGVQSGASQRMEASVPLKDYEELRIKLRILEAKRGEDRERVREAEKAKEESEQFLSIRTKLQAKLTEMQQELRDSKRSLKDALAEKDAFESKYNDVLETMEVTMLDKEMAEEKAENLQYEVDMLKEKVEEINVDLHVFQQEEANLANKDRPAVGQLQLEKQNERLTEALR